MADTLFSRLVVFVLVLVALDVFFGWQVSILGSLAVTFLVYAIVSALESRSERKGAAEGDRS